MISLSKSPCPGAKRGAARQRKLHRMPLPAQTPPRAAPAATTSASICLDSARHSSCSCSRTPPSTSFSRAPGPCAFSPGERRARGQGVARQARLRCTRHRTLSALPLAGTCFTWTRSWTLARWGAATSPWQSTPATGPTRSHSGGAGPHVGRVPASASAQRHLHVPPAPRPQRLIRRLGGVDDPGQAAVGGRHARRADAHFVPRRHQRLPLPLLEGAQAACATRAHPQASASRARRGRKRADVDALPFPAQAVLRGKLQDKVQTSRNIRALLLGMTIISTFMFLFVLQASCSSAAGFWLRPCHASIGALQAQHGQSAACTS